ncbi:Spy/CpxP family protein refolding chaperone [Alkaliflexus imshenetskii]|uniref:Spy/CpxP family protein refolding chaperone n=1 Tax=Alkaliflexus imshenetskii TaxID=286730 RepID=UPI000478FF7F|nr:Spy/CpxP family protein refolding chaperone [Alkaliflexus imshenetskii]
MNTITIRIYSLALVLCLAMNVAAQKRQKEIKPRATTSTEVVEWQERHIENLSKELSLTAEQEAQLRAVLEKRRGEASAMRETRRKEMEARRAEQKARAEATRERMQLHDEEIKALLTEEQKLRYDQLRQERAAEARQRMADRRQQQQNRLDETTKKSDVPKSPRKKSDTTY